MWGKELIELGSRWRVGNGWSISIYKDRWIPRLSTFKIMTFSILGDKAPVSVLKLRDGSWNVDVVKGSFSREEANAILGLPCSNVELEDSLLWQFEKSGNYSMRSGY